MKSRAPIGDGWYESEESTRLALISELQRIKRRTWVRPLPVLALAALITAAVTYKFATRPKLYQANVVLALSEGALSPSTNKLQYERLRDYVVTLLLSDARLTELIERRNLSPLRRKLGMQFALDELRGQLDVEIWKNSFMYFDDPNAQKSARIGLTVTDTDPDLAFDLARDLATVAIRSHDEQRRKLSEAVTRDVERVRGALDRRMIELSATRTEKQAALAAAEAAGASGTIGVLRLELAVLAGDIKRAGDQIAQLATSPEAVADRITAAHLDTTLAIVEERRPERRDNPGMVLAMLIAVIGTGSLVGAALVIGAFDSRVHDVDDVTRLGLPILGHVPGFPGDDVGSLAARGAARARVPLFQRWRSHR